MNRFITPAPTYEPRATPGCFPTAPRTICRPSGSQRLKRSTSAESGRVTPNSRPTASHLPPGSVHDAAETHRFAEQTLRLVLEVLDRRRPYTSLRPCLSPGLIDSVGSLARNKPPGAMLGVGNLIRVRLRHNSVGTAEVFATYSRGNRVFALAGRIDRKDARWQLTALCIA